MASVVFLNGELVASEKAMISVFDRGFLYGDGLFETMRVAQGCPFRWDRHWDRFQRGLDSLRIRIPFGEAELRKAIGQLVEVNQIQQGVARLAVSRGVGARGYSPKGADRPTVTLGLSPFPEATRNAPMSWTLATSTLRLPPGNLLSSIKTANKLTQVIARAEAEEARADEALLLNTEGNVAESTSGTLFWIQSGNLLTPPLSDGGLAGVSRSTVQELAGSLGIACREASVPPMELLAAEGVFLTMSTFGVLEITELDRSTLRRSSVTRQLWEAYERCVAIETRVET